MRTLPLTLVDITEIVTAFTYKLFYVWTKRNETGVNRLRLCWALSNPHHMNNCVHRNHKTSIYPTMWIVLHGSPAVSAPCLVYNVLCCVLQAALCCIRGQSQSGEVQQCGSGWSHGALGLQGTFVIQKTASFNLTSGRKHPKNWKEFGRTVI